jgi:hypothetical protein
LGRYSERAADRDRARARFKFRALVSIADHPDLGPGSAWPRSRGVSGLCFAIRSCIWISKQFIPYLDHSQAPRPQVKEISPAILFRFKHMVCAIRGPYVITVLCSALRCDAHVASRSNPPGLSSFLAIDSLCHRFGTLIGSV